MVGFVDIIYGGVAPTMVYKGVSFSSDIKEEDKIFYTGDFLKDWYFCQKYLVQIKSKSEGSLSYSSTVNHFVTDGAPYQSRYLSIVDGKGFLNEESNGEQMRFFVPNDQDFTWGVLQAYCEELNI